MERRGIVSLSIFLIACLILSLSLFSGVAGSEPQLMLPDNSNRTNSNRTRGPPQYQIRIEQVEPRQPQGCIACSYVGGYEDIDYNSRKADALRATFSFPNTDQSAIPEGQYLKGWIESVVFTNVNCLDYGYRVGVELNRNEMIVWAEVWEFCEGLPYVSQCGDTPYAKLLLGSGWVISASPSDKIEVKMQWDDPDTVGFYYRINGGSYIRFAEYPSPSPAQSRFSLGKKWWPDDLVKLRLAKYYQFPLESPSNIGGGGWNLLIEYPSYLSSGTWSLVSRA